MTRNSSDLTSALLMPDLRVPSEASLKTFALYWDQLLLPDYRDRQIGGESSIPGSATLETLQEAGVAVIHERTIDLSAIYGDEADRQAERLRFELPPHIRDLVRPLIKTGATAEAIARATREIDVPTLEITMRVEGTPHQVPLPISVLAEAVYWNAARHHITRCADALGLAQTNHLAPLSVSLLGHLGSLVGPQADVPRAEAALLSAAMSAFELSPDTPTEDVLRFRTKHGDALGRFRAALADLSENLTSPGAPNAVLGAARDTYRNRVEPALGDLEAVLKESNLTFFVKSLFGVSALAIGAVEPKTAVEGAAQITSQTINYAFSKQKLIREHPYGYLHSMSRELGAKPTTRSGRLLEPLEPDAAETIRRLLADDYTPREVFGGFFAPTWVERWPEDLRD